MFSSTFFLYLQRVSKGAQDILLNSLTNHHQRKEQLSLLGLSRLGAAFPYLRVVCGEP